MGIIPRPQDKWTEFQWGRELQNDERRINYFLRELQEGLDLPGVEEKIISSMLSHPDLAPPNPSDNTVRCYKIEEDYDYYYDEDEDEEDGDEEDALELELNNADIVLVDRLDKLAVEWNAISALYSKSDQRLPGLGISCAYGKLLLHLGDFSSLEDQLNRELKISLGKRVLSDLNELVGMLMQFCTIVPSLTKQIQEQISTLSDVRGQLIDRIQGIRETPREKFF